MKKIKLLVVSSYFYPKMGGLENYALNICKSLMRNYNYDIVVVTSNYDNPKEYKEETIQGMKIYRLPISFKISNTPMNLSWKKQIKEIVKKEQPNIINAHTPVPFIADMACRVAHKLHIPFLLTYHNDLTKDNPILNFIGKNYYWFIGNKTLNQSTRIIATSKYYSQVSPYLKKRKDKVDIVSPGVDFTEKKNFAKSPNTIIFVGRLEKTHRHKGLNYLIDAIPAVKEKIKDIRLNVAGGGDNMAEYEEQIKNLHLENEVKLLGNVTDEELSRQYDKSQVILLPSYTSSEGFGMVLIECMAHKCVPIGTKIGGIPYVINDKVDGLLVPPKDSSSLSEAIIKTLSNNKLLKSMGESAYKKVKENFTWDISSKKMNDIILNVLKQKQ